MLLVSALVNLLGLASSLWLGFYILTRSPRSRISWLTALSLWSLSSYFFSNSLAAYQPESGALLWPRFLVFFALPAWLNLTLELIARGEKAPQRLGSPIFTRAGIVISYLIALLLVLVGILAPRLILELPNGPRLFTRDPGVGPLYPLIPIFLLVNIALALFVLARGRHAAFSISQRRQFSFFLIATGMAGVGGVYVAIGTFLQLDLPAFLGDAVLAAGVTLLGYVVAKYNALIEGRRVERDFLYAMVAVGTLTLFYVLITLLFYLDRQISFLTLVLTIIGSLSFNALYDGVRVALDRLFYREQFVALRQNLRSFSQEVGTGQRLDDQLQAALKSFCHALQIRKGFIALSDGENFVVRATLDANPIGEKFALPLLTATEIVGLVRPERKGLNAMSLLVPLFGGGSQIGAILLGEKESKEPYSEQELEFLDEVGEMARVIHATRTQEEDIQKINAMVEDYRERERNLQLQLEQLLEARATAPTGTPSTNEEEFEGQVEDGLRHLHDFSYLGEHPLGNLRAVQALIKTKGTAISVDRGKGVSEVLHNALEKLRPDGAEPSSREIPSREWHPYIILHDSYVRDEPNRNVMARLYVGEGTFNRTRRRAIKSVAQALQEMEGKSVMRA